MLLAIRHEKGDPLALMLVTFQPQLSENDDIYIIDTTPDREGHKIAEKFGSSKSLILTETGDYDAVTSVEFFKEYAKANNHSLVTYIKNVLVSTTFVSNLKKAISLNEFGIISPEILPSKKRLNPNFKWYSQPISEVEECKHYTPRIFCVNDKGTGIGKFNEKVVIL